MVTSRQIKRSERDRNLLPLFTTSTEGRFAVPPFPRYVQLRCRLNPSVVRRRKLPGAHYLILNSKPIDRKAMHIHQYFCINVFVIFFVCRDRIASSSSKDLFGECAKMDDQAIASAMKHTTLDLTVC